MTHEMITAAGLAAPVGYAHAVVAAPGRPVYLGGQTAQGPDGQIVGDTLPVQLDVAAGNLLASLRAAGGRPEDIVSMQIFVTDAAAYRNGLRELGSVYRAHFGRHYPAMALLEVKALFDPAARIELMAVAVIPDGSE
jgi:enamine deaminase RidA (YjgF/YER057c/UK114 family)